MVRLVVALCFLFALVPALAQDGGMKVHARLLAEDRVMASGARTPIIPPLMLTESGVLGAQGS